MSGEGKRRRAAAGMFKDGAVDISEALSIIDEYGKAHSAKFDETVEVAIRLGVDPRQSDQMVRGSVSMPEGLGKKIVVWAFVDDSDIETALKAGADRAGFEDLVADIESSGVSFDRCVATPGVMPSLAAKLGRTLGKQRMMPNPKLGTVGTDIAGMVATIKAGTVEFKNDKGGVVHAPVGKLSFGPERLRSNILALYNALMDVKPKAVKKSYIETFSLSTTHGLAQRVDSKSLAV